MRLFLILASLVCVAQCGDVLIRLLQEVHIGKCGLGCSRCSEPETNTTNLAAAQAKLTQLEDEKEELEEQKDDAQTTSDSVSDAGDATTNLTNSATSERRRRRRDAATVNLTSCEDSSETISGTSEEIILLVINGISNELRDIADSVSQGIYSIDVTTLTCYISLALDLSSLLDSGDLEKPDNITAISAAADSVTTQVNDTTSTLTIVIVNLETEIEEKEEEIQEQEAVVISAGGSVDVTFRDIFAGR